jgi:hypothetical protein
MKVLAANNIGDNFNLVVSITYDATGLASAVLTDTPLLGWVTDETGVALPVPVVPGSLPSLPPDTAPISSPTWAHCVIIPTDKPALIGAPRIDVYSGSDFCGGFTDFLSFVAANNDATRQLDGSGFVTGVLAAAWWRWAQQNPSSVAPSAWQHAPEDARGFGPHADSPAAPAA